MYKYVLAFLMIMSISAFGQLGELPASWSWSDSSSFGPDSVLFADSSNHSDASTFADDVDTTGTDISTALGNKMFNVGDTVTGTYNFSDNPLEAITIIDFDDDMSAPAHQEARIFYDPTDNTLSVYNNEADITLNVGQEGWVYARNVSGSTILDGKVVYVVGAVSSRPLIRLAQADAEATCKLIGVATHDIETATNGYVTLWGTVHGIDLSDFSDGNEVFLSATVAGSLTTVAPSAPNCVVEVGHVVDASVNGDLLVLPGKNKTLNLLSDVLISGPTTNDMLVFDGAVWGDTSVLTVDNVYKTTSAVPDSVFSTKGYIDTQDGIFYDSATTFLDGMAYDKSVLTVLNSSSANGIVLDVEKDGTGDIIFHLDGVDSELDCTTGGGVGGKARVVLTDGSDANTPTTNYIYVTNSGGTATLLSSTSRPTGSFAWVGKVVIPDSATFNTTGAYLFQRYTESELNDSRGLFSHEREKIRELGALYISGIAPTISIGTDGGGPDTVHLAVTAGQVHQLHRQTFPSFATGPYYYGNGQNQYEQLDADSGLSAALEMIDGTSLAGSRFNLVIWGAINYDSATCKLFVNLPNGSYNNTNQTIADRDNTADYTVPADLRSVAFLIARLPMQHQSGSGGTWTPLGDSVYSLLGTPVGVRAGGSGGAVASNEFADSDFRIFDNIDPTKIIALEASAITTGNTRTITMADGNIDLATMMLNTGDIVTGVYDFGGATSLEIPNSDNPTVNANGEVAWENDDNLFRTWDGSANRAIGTVKSIDFEIVLPDSVNAYAPLIKLMTIDVLKAPFGIKILAINVSTQVSTTDTLAFWEFASPAVGDSSLIDTVIVSAGYEQRETTITDSDIATSSYVYVNLSSGTGLNRIGGSIVYYIKTGD